MRRKDTKTTRQRLHVRVRRKVSGTAERPRLCIYRSLNHIYAQVVDDNLDCTIISASTLEPGVRSAVKGETKVAASALIGKMIASRALERGLVGVVFDRGGYKYHGRVKALAEAAREGGLVF